MDKSLTDFVERFIMKRIQGTQDSIMSTPLYPIRAVSRLTGLSVDTLRAWERRYRVVVPQRGPNGRLYSEVDIQRLLLLREGLEHGHSIGRLARMAEGDVKEMLKLPGISMDKPSTRGRSSLEEETVAQLVQAVECFDYATMDELLGRMALLLPLRTLIHQVVLPLLQVTGERWHEGSFSVAQEHMVSGLVRNLLGGLIRVHRAGEAPARLLFATTAGERHEFGILVGAMLAAGSGLDALYLGPDLPAEEIVTAACKSSSDIVVLGLVHDLPTPEEVESTRNDLALIAAELPESTELWIGGEGLDPVLRGNTSSRLRVLNDFAHFEQQLKRLGGHF